MIRKLYKILIFYFRIIIYKKSVKNYNQHDLENLDIKTVNSDFLHLME